MKPRYFTKYTKLYYDGYPRSGNTFFQHLADSIPVGEAAHHLHKVAPLKIALQKNLPSFVLIRNPGDAISSNYLKHHSYAGKLPTRLNRSLLRRMINDYLRYYDFVEDNADNVHIVSFDQLINEPSQVMYDVAQKLGYSHSEDYISMQVQDTLGRYRGCTSTLGSSRPNDTKERHKDDLKKAMRTWPGFLRCESVYESIMSGVLVADVV